MRRQESDKGCEAIRERLFSMAEPGYRDFTAKLIPNVPADRILGVRTPQLRALAKELRGTGEAAAFLEALPHGFQEENQLHSFLLSFEKDFPLCMEKVEAFLPHVDNWAVCDCMTLPCFRRHRPELAAAVERWLASGLTYTVRFGIKQLMDHFLEKDFDPKYPVMVASVSSEEYYVNMMKAWYFATALAKQWEAVLPWLTERRLDPWVHNKTIQKAVESFRIPEDRKALLRGLRQR